MNHVIIRRTILMEKYFIRVSAAIVDNIQKVNLYKALNSIWGSSVSLGPISTFDSTPTHPKFDDDVDLSPSTLSPSTLSPSTLPPSTLSPSTLPPSTLSPSTLPPSTLSPSTLSPSTLSPSTLSPSTLSPSTLPPSTLPPSTLSPSTLPPSALLQSSTQVAFPQSPQTVTQPQTPIQPSSSDRDSNTGSVGDEERSVGTDTDDDMFSIDDCPCKSPLIADDSDADVRSLNTHCIIVDWDDTLMATTQLMTFIQQQTTKNEECPSNQPIKFNHCNYSDFNCVYQEALNLLEIRIVTFLAVLQRLGDVYIVTNSEQGWVQMSCKQYLPSVWNHISNIPIISARTTYESTYPKDFYMWKLMAFQSCIQPHHKILMSFGDSPIDHKAAEDTGILKNVQVKNIKFSMCPDITLLNAQLGLIISFLPKIYEHSTDSGFSVLPSITNNTIPPSLRFIIIE